MKINKKPVHLIQIFDNSYRYDKNHKSFEDRKETVKWKDSILSNSFTIENGQVFLDKKLIKNQNSILSNCIILIDYNIESMDDYFQYLNLFGFVKNGFSSENKFREYFEKREKVKFCTLGKQRFLWNILEFTKEEAIQIKLVWDYAKVGTPKREKFKIAELKKNKPVEITIDGIHDGYHKRIFVENNFILEYLGQFDEIFEKRNLEHSKKRIPKERKRINLLKYLK
jgi:hypothetical protein